MNLTSIFKDLYCGDKYYIYKDKLNGKIYFNKVGNGAGGFVRINKDEVPDDILSEISKDMI